MWCRLGLNDFGVEVDEPHSFPSKRWEAPSGDAVKVADLFNTRKPLESIRKAQFTVHVSKNFQRAVRGLLRKTLSKLSEPEAMKGHGFALSRGK